MLDLFSDDKVLQGYLHIFKNLTSTIPLEKVTVTVSLKYQ